MTYERFDPFPGKPDDMDDEQWLTQQGWEPSLGIGDTNSIMQVQSYRRTVDDHVECIAYASDLLGGTGYIKVGGPGELMDLLARWAPAVQAAAIVHTLDDIRSSRLDADGIVEVISAKVNHGQHETLPMLQGYLREQRKHEREIRERRAAARRAAEQ